MEIEDVIRGYIEKLRAEGFMPVGFTIEGLNPGEVPRTIIDYERVVDGVVEKRRWIVE